MDLFEYQARDLFDKHGVPVLEGFVATSVEDVRQGAEKLLANNKVVVVKAQVKTGGRGKAGGVKLARTVDETIAHADAILGMDIKGHTVKTIMVAAGADIAEEYYFSMLLDRANRSYLAMCSREGGVEIETLAVERPEALAKVPVDPNTGITPEVAADIASQAGFSADEIEKLVPVFVKLGQVYAAEDATLVEVNPMVKTTDGTILALDGKVSLDGNSDFRHPEHAELEDKAATDPLEAAAKEKGLNYVKLDGDVGVIGNGAGLVMSTLDVVAYAGEDLAAAEGLSTAPSPANFLDIGGGASAQVMEDGLAIILGDEQVKSVFVNVFGGITSCDQVAEGIVGALNSLGDNATKPLVVRLDGNNVEAGRAILAAANHPLVNIEATMDGAAAKAAQLAAQA